ncbi:MAG: hypothetical protein ACOX89_04300 [Lutispora sp.]|jgi:hypothetical protein
MDAYQELVQNELGFDEEDDYYRTENEINSPPTLKDLIETKSLFREFRITNVEIPKFKTYGQLLRWRRDVIKKHLDNWEE